MRFLMFLVLIVGAPVAGFAVSRDLGLVVAAVALVIALAMLGELSGRPPARRRRRR